MQKILIIAGYLHELKRIEASPQKLGKYVKGLLSAKSRRQALFLCLDTAHNNDITQRKMPNVLPEGMNHEEVRILR